MRKEEAKHKQGGFEGKGKEEAVEKGKHAMDWASAIKNSKQCGVSLSICEHSRRRSKCKHCSGSSICEHNRERSRCKQGGGSSICEHNLRISIWEHNR
jgi:hypothetical protein